MMRLTSSIIVVFALTCWRESVGNDCDNYNESHNSDCTEVHCSANAARPSDGAFHDLQPINTELIIHMYIYEYTFIYVYIYMYI